LFDVGIFFCLSRRVVIFSLFLFSARGKRSSGRAKDARTHAERDREILIPRARAFSLSFISSCDSEGEVKKKMSSKTIYERERDERVKANAEKMQKMLGEAKRKAFPYLQDHEESKKKQKKNETTIALPKSKPLLFMRRTSARERKPVNYAEDKIDVSISTPTLSNASEKKRAFGTYDPPKTREEAQKSAVFYKQARNTTKEKEVYPENSVLKRDETTGKLTFRNIPSSQAHFQPNLTPKEIIQAGTFGGCYFNPRGGKKGFLKRPILVTSKEFPEEWFENMSKGLYENRVYKSHRNLYQVKAGQDQYYWEEHGWINEQDPRGWFQWYCRFYLGRRTADDARQISRWTGVGGEKGRWKNNLLNKIVSSNRRFDDASISPVVRQTMLHWAIEVTEKDCLKFAKSKGYKLVA